ncbi:hypothetical protein ACFQ07_16795, partial [Actinomadura adrarensis]
MDGFATSSWSTTETMGAPREPEEFTWGREHLRALSVLAVLVLCAALLVRAAPPSPPDIALPGSVKIEGLRSAKQILPGADLVYVLGTSTGDDRVVALDARTGRQRWSEP